MSADVRTILETIADATTLNPSAAGKHFTAAGDLVGLFEVEVRTGSHTITVDQPEALGGRAVGPTPVEYALAALGSCVAETYRFWSEKLAIKVDKLALELTGDLDIRGIFGIEDGVRPGFSQVTVGVTVSGPESQERYEELRRAVDEHSPMLDVFANGLPVKTTLAVA